MQDVPILPKDVVLLCLVVPDSATVLLAIWIADPPSLYGDPVAWRCLGMLKSSGEIFLQFPRSLSLTCPVIFLYIMPLTFCLWKLSRRRNSIVWKSHSKLVQLKHLMRLYINYGVHNSLRDLIETQHTKTVRHQKGRRPFQVSSSWVHACSCVAPGKEERINREQMHSSWL